MSGGDCPGAGSAHSGGQPLRPLALRGGTAAHHVFPGYGGERGLSGLLLQDHLPRHPQRVVGSPPPIYQKVVFGKQATDLCSSSYNQLFVHGFISSGEWREYVDRLRDIYRSRRDAMLEVLEQGFPAGSTWTKPVGGFFVWATLPGGLDTGDLLVKAVEENVAFVRGDAFYADGQGTSSMRLSFSAVPEEKIQEGIRRLGRVAQDQLDLYRAMGL